MWFYFSFVDNDRPKGDRFVGGLYIRVPDDAENLPHRDALWRTLQESHRLGLNPGGEVKTVGPIPDEQLNERVLPKDRYRLLSKAEIEANDRRLMEEGVLLTARIVVDGETVYEGPA